LKWHCTLCACLGVASRGKEVDEGKSQTNMVSKAIHQQHKTYFPIELRIYVTWKHEEQISRIEPRLRIKLFGAEKPDPSSQGELPGPLE